MVVFILTHANVTYGVILGLLVLCCLILARLIAICLVLRCCSRLVRFGYLTGIAIISFRLLFLFFLLILFRLDAIRLCITILILVSHSILLLFRYRFCRWLDRVRVFCREINGLLDELFHDKYVQVKLLAHALGLFFLASKGVASKAYLDRKPVGILWVLEARSLRKIDLDNLLDSVAQEEIVFRGVGHFQFCLVKRNFRWSALCRCLCFAFGVDLRGWVENFVKFRLALRHDICRPLAQIFEVIDQLKLVELQIRSINLGLFLDHILARILLWDKIG